MSIEKLIKKDCRKEKLKRRLFEERIKQFIETGVNEEIRKQAERYSSKTVKEIVYFTPTPF